MIQYGLEFNDGAGSTIETALAPLANTRTATFNLAPCTGIQAHYHTNHELFQPIKGSLTVGVVNQTNVWRVFNVSAGQLLEIPAGDIHYMLNSGCSGAILVGTWPLETNTTFLLPALGAFPPEAQLMFGQSAFPAVRGTFPLIRDAACLARCGAAAPAAGTAG
ncbi:hypothetical protein OEZ85_003629 [Tetradesmus obliquus]|uniref:Cupin type-1 domain-containing protein n=1 Tax=Tetradesmus obliquus TaxID=3088 RepID=A0ABY8UCF0_TETOB|nr:hypothetical protein OEZ85_003629 [Tetradesmus obliquus]